jgi:hypothetical protein
MTTRKADSLRVKNLESLYCEALLGKPVNYDWYGDGHSSLEELGETWEVIQPFNEDDFKDEDEYWEACDQNQPMMNYYYPLPDERQYDESDAAQIQRLNLCLIYFVKNNNYALALTGGGMDLSWDICEGFIRLGYYPPVHFRLPNLAGTPNDEHHQTIIQACIKGREIVKRWMDNDVKDLEATRDNLGK